MAKTYVLILGIILIALGVLGFITPLAPGGNLFGFLATGTTHCLVYLISGILAVAAVAGGKEYPRLYVKVFGIIFAVFTVAGFMVGDGIVLGLLNVNAADNILHLLIAASALYVGFTHEHTTARPAAA
jgi:hypothetical protein